MTAVSDRRNEVASRVAEAFHSTADPTRPPEVCVPQRVRQPLLPRRLSLRPAEPAPRPAPHRLAPGHDPAVPPWPVGGGHRRAVGLRPWHGAPWVHRYNPHGTSGMGDRPRAGRPPLGSPRLHQRILSLLDQPKAWTIGRLWQRLGRPALSQRTLRRRVRQVACWRRRTIFGDGAPASACGQPVEIGIRLGDRDRFHRVTRAPGSRARGRGPTGRSAAAGPDAPPGSSRRAARAVCRTGRRPGARSSPSPSSSA